MDRMNLELHGTGADGMLLALLLGVSGILCAWGVVQLLRRRWRSGVVSLAAAAGPAVMLPVLLIDSAVRFTRGDSRAGRASLLAGVVVAVLTGGAAVLWLGSAAGGTFWMALLGVQLAVAVGVIYSGVYAHLGGVRLAVLMLLRVLGIIALLGVLFKPVIMFSIDPDAHKPALGILLDRSASMSTAAGANLPDRYSQAIQMLRSQRKRLGRYFRVAWYDFARQSGRSESLGDLGLLKPSGEGTDATDIASALRSAGESAGESAGADRQAGVLLISDGVHNTAGDPIDQARKLAVPVFAVAVGTRTAGQPGRANLELLWVDAPVEAVANNVTKLKVGIRITRFPNAGGEVRLYEGTDKTPVATEKIWTASNDETITARLNWTPRAADGDAAKNRLRKLRIEIAPNALECNPHDNSAELHVLLINPKIRLLYIEGTMRPEYKYLRRLLQTDPNVQFMGLVRVAGNRFWAQGGIDGKKLKALPDSDEDFEMFDVIILGDLGRSFFSSGQLARLRKFVSDGGGLLMIGGRNSFGPGGYGGTDLEAALPVLVGPRSSRQQAEPFLPTLTAVGQQHPIFAGISGYFPGPGGRTPQVRLAKLPPLRGCVTVQRLKSAAAGLAVHPSRRNEAGPLVVLAVQRFGAGRSAAFTADTTWQWFLPLRALGAESPYERFWGQVVRWLANVETKTRQLGSSSVLRISRAYCRLGGQVKLTAHVRQANGQPAGKARVSVELVPLGGKAQKNETIPLTPTASVGVYQAQYSPAQAGDYTLKLSAVSADGTELGTDELKLKVAGQSAELEQLGPNEQLLRDLAGACGGQFADISALPDLLDNIIERQQRLAGPPVRPEIHRLYNFPLLFVLFVLLLTAEWLLRRTWQLS